MRGESALAGGRHPSPRGGGVPAVEQVVVKGAEGMAEMRGGAVMRPRATQGGG
jgi:hypothetical protein